MSVLDLCARRSKNAKKQLESEVLRAVLHTYQPFLEKIVSSLEAGKPDSGMGLLELSDMAQEAVLAVANAAFEKLLQSKASAAAKRAKCPKCDSMRDGRMKERVVETRHGEVKIERPYHYCKTCRHGFVPFDEMMGLSESRKQDDIRQAMLRLSAEMPFEKASEIFAELTGRVFSDRAAHDLLAQVGKEITVESVLPKAEIIQKKIDDISSPGKRRPVLVISADGAHIPMRPDGKWARDSQRGPGEWSEAKGFRAYLISHDRIIQLASWHQVCDEEDFGSALKAFSRLFDHSSVRIALVADGAKWIWKHFSAIFPKGRQVLDYYHCKQHLWSFAKAQFEEKEDQYTWVEASISRLFLNQADSVVWGLQRTNARNAEAAEELRLLLGYLGTNKDRLNYRGARKAQAPLGSGAIESSNKQICQVRMKRPGAWWGRPGANHMLALRCASVNGTITQVYLNHKNQGANA